MLFVSPFRRARLLAFRLALALALTTTLAAASAPAGALAYDAEPASRPRVLLDYYHRSRPEMRIGNHVVSGSWLDSRGRYAWDDFVHTNSFDPFFIALAHEFALHVQEAPFSDELLAGFDIAVVINPETPKMNPHARVMTDDEIAALTRFVRGGGSLLVMTNGGGRDYEDYERAQLGKLLAGFGLACRLDDTHYSDNTIGDAHPYLYDVPIFHYGAGCTLEILSHAERPTILTENYSSPAYTDREVRGPGMVLVRPGKGKLLLIGDTGSWTGNIARPWAENERVLKQVFRYLKRDAGVQPAKWTKGDVLTYEMTATGLNAIPVRNSTSEIPRPLHRDFTPRPITKIPYLEASARLQLTCHDVSSRSAAKLEARIDDFKWFDRPETSSGNATVQLTASRQGKVSGLTANGDAAHWIAPDIPALVALLPVDGLRPGDRWESIELLRVPTVTGTGTPTVKPLELEIAYAGNETIEGRACRLLRAEGQLWLSDAGVRIEDLLPLEEVRRVGGTPYAYYHPRGGKLMFKREQWVDRDTGVVVRARVQTRTLLWIRDQRETSPDPANLQEVDTEMIASLAQVVNFRLVR